MSLHNIEIVFLDVIEFLPLSQTNEIPEWLANSFKGKKLVDCKLSKITLDGSFPSSVGSTLEQHLGKKVHVHVIGTIRFDGDEIYEFPVLFFVPNHPKDEPEEISSISVLIVCGFTLGIARAMLQNSPKANWLEKRNIVIEELFYTFANISRISFVPKKALQAKTGY